MQRQEAHVEAALPSTPVGQRSDEPDARADRPDPKAAQADEFAFIVAHDLKEPLTGIRAYCEILLEDYEANFDADGRRRLGALVKMCDRLAASIDGLLDYCRAGQARPAPTDVDLNAVLQDVLETLNPAIDRRRGLVRVADPLPVVRGEPTAIAQVFSNLISNGLKFNENDRPRVEIGRLAGDPPTIYVRDNGIGIARKHHEAIFTIFRRLHSRQQFEGTGAGLTIVRRIVESLGGRIWVDSEPGRGTTFFFTLLPAVADTSALESAPRAPHWVQGHSASRESVREPHVSSANRPEGRIRIAP